MRKSFPNDAWRVARNRNLLRFRKDSVSGYVFFKLLGTDILQDLLGILPSVILGELCGTEIQLCLQGILYQATIGELLRAEIFLDSVLDELFGTQIRLTSGRTAVQATFAR